MPSKYHVSLADLSQAEGADIPLSLLQAWETSDKSPEREKELLSPYEVEGTVVATDSSGLSKLSQELGLLEVMQLIHIPKKVVYTMGSLLGGEPIGIWAADNTLMFYPKEIPVSEVIRAMQKVQASLKKSRVQIGMGIHRGTFIKIGNALYGPEAEYVEELAENHTEGGEIALSITTLNSFTSNHSVTPKACALNHESVRLDSSFEEELPLVPILDRTYPLPFDPSFYGLLESVPFEELSQVSLEPYEKTTTIILTKITVPENHSLLENALMWTLLRVLYKECATTHKVHIIKSQGGLHISESTDAKAALAFALELKETLKKLSFSHTTALSHGPILLFTLENKERDVAGNPVNIASKLAEDSGEEGILIEESVPLSHLEGPELLFHISGVPLKAKKSR